MMRRVWVWKQMWTLLFALMLAACGGSQQQAVTTGNQLQVEGAVVGPARTVSAVRTATGGTALLSGLSPGSQIIVASGNGVTRTLQQDGFFSVEYISDAERTLEIIAQPAHQICTIDGELGQVSFGRDATPRIECEVREVQVNGYVSGLTGSGLELRLNGAETIARVQNGVFKSVGYFSVGSQITVAVETEPQNRSCTLAQAMVRVKADSSNAILVLCTEKRLWRESVPLDGRSDAALSSAMNANGQAVIVERLPDKRPKNGLWVYRFDPAKGWSAPEPIGTEFSEFGNFATALGNDGNVTVVWENYHPTVPTDLSWKIWAAHYVVGAGWTHPAIIHSGPTSIHSFQLSADDQGELQLILMQRDAGSPDAAYIRTMHYAPDSGWDAALVHTDSGILPEQPSFQMNGQGRGCLVWADNSNNAAELALYGKAYSHESGWQSRQLITPRSVLMNSYYYSKVFVGPDGQCTVFWRKSYDNAELYSRRFSPGTGWGDETSVISGEGFDSNQYSILFDNAGNGLITWYSNGLRLKPYSTELGWLATERFTSNAVNFTVARDGHFFAAGDWAAPETLFEYQIGVGMSTRYVDLEPDHSIKGLLGSSRGDLLLILRTPNYGLQAQGYY